MKLISLICTLFLLGILPAHAQIFARYIDSVRIAYHMPELAVAVVSADSIMYQQCAGYKKINTQLQATPTDRFRIGSCTKTITAFIAALLVKEGKIKWDTKLFDIYPELKAKSNAAYHDITLLDLLSFRTKLCKYTYTDPVPVRDQFTGNEDKQRYQFMQWALGLPPVAGSAATSFSNPGYTMAGLMLERASGRRYKQLVADLGRQLDIDFRFGAPNSADDQQPWGHNSGLLPEPPGDNYKLEWLLPAGNINMTVGDYAKFIQLQLQGLAGYSPLLSAAEFRFLHYGLPGFAVGWYWEEDERHRRVSHHAGNPGTFLSQAYVHAAAGRGYILLTNVQSPQAEEGLALVYAEMQRRYGK